MWVPEFPCHALPQRPGETSDFSRKNARGAALGASLFLFSCHVGRCLARATGHPSLQFHYGHDEFPKGCEVLEVWTSLSATLISCKKAHVSLFSGVTAEAYGYFSISFLPSF